MLALKLPNRLSVARWEVNMLALTRKKDEALILNNNIEIKILDIRGDQIKIGIEAPREVSIYRKEIYQQIQEANKESMSVSDVAALNDLF
jgi:carbon storage regulator